MHVDIGVGVEHLAERFGRFHPVLEVGHAAGPPDRHPITLGAVQVEHVAVHEVGEHHDVRVVLAHLFGQRFGRHGDQIGDLNAVLVRAADGFVVEVGEPVRRVRAEHVVIGLVDQLDAAGPQVPQLHAVGAHEPLADDRVDLTELVVVRGELGAGLGEHDPVVHTAGQMLVRQVEPVVAGPVGLVGLPEDRQGPVTGPFRLNRRRQQRHLCGNLPTGGLAGLRHHPRHPGVGVGEAVDDV
jgi:hypothetical protein